MSGPPAAMVLAAGRGTGLGKLSDTLPKPLQQVGGRPVIVGVLERLRDAGVRRCVVNLHHLGDMIAAELGDGAQLGLEIVYSREAELLETAGGIAQALHLLGSKPFLLANGDVCSDYDYRRLVATAGSMGDRLAHMVLGANPEHRPEGDFSLDADYQVTRLQGTGHAWTCSAVYAPELFDSVAPGNKAFMWPLWERAMDEGRMTGELHPGRWIDIGTPARLEQARAMFGG